MDLIECPFRLKNWPSRIKHDSRSPQLTGKTKRFQSSHRNKIKRKSFERASHEAIRHPKQWHEHAIKCQLQPISAIFIYRMAHMINSQSRHELRMLLTFGQVETVDFVSMDFPSRAFQFLHRIWRRRNSIHRKRGEYPIQTVRLWMCQVSHHTCATPQNVSHHRILCLAEFNHVVVVAVIILDGISPVNCWTVCETMKTDSTSRV